MKRALLSVSNKTGIVAFAKSLIEQGYSIISTGGTQKVLQEAGVAVTGVEDVTQFPECFSGRVKTMHPLIMGGVLFRRDDSEHTAQAEQLGIGSIDLVVVNLYPFEESLKKFKMNNSKLKIDEILPELIEQIDIGGPTLLRSAAKNYNDVTVVCDIQDYDRVIEEIQMNGDTSLDLRRELSTKVFTRTAAYDALIAETLSDGQYKGLVLDNGTGLRYGENPHQSAKYYDQYPSLIQNVPDTPMKGASWQQLCGKHMSYLNLLDADGAWNLVVEFDQPTASCIKHANPSGVASADTIEEAFQRSYDADRLSAFGVIIALNRTCTKNVINKILEQKIFVELILAPDFEEGSLELLAAKPNVRAVKMNQAVPEEERSSQLRSALGGYIEQNFDTRILTEADLTCVTNVAPTDDQILNLLFAWKVVKHSKSNAIVFAKDLVTLGIGCGQTSRVDSTWIAAKRANNLDEHLVGANPLQGAVMASDAFFPFPDSLEEAAKHGIVAIIQPGGSIKDEQVIAKANELGIAMLTTGVRAFRH